MTRYGPPTVYRNTEILSSSGPRLILLLYQRLLLSLKAGARSIRDRDIEAKFVALSRASDIVSELLAALDFEKGGELAGRLASLYGFWAKEISAAGRTLDAQRIDRVADMVTSLSQAWDHASKSVPVGDTGARARPVA